MSTYYWYLIFNLAEFNALGLPSREYTLNLEGIGQKTIIAFKGNEVSILYEGVFLTVNLNDNNPFEFDGYAVYLSQPGDVYLGVPIES